MYLSRELTDSSLPKIGKEFGGRDHTTVLHANAKITRMIKEDRAVYNLVQDLTAGSSTVDESCAHAPCGRPRQWDRCTTPLPGPTVGSRMRTAFGSVFPVVHTP